MTDTQQQIEESNRVELWKDVLNRLEIAADSLDHAIIALDDLAVPHISENLVPLFDGVVRFRDLAKSKVEA